MGTLVARGWRDRATRLLLFDTYVRSSLLYGAAVWGSYLLHPSCTISVDCTGKMGSFYRGALRTLLGVGRIRNEVVYILSGRYPLQLYIAKFLWRYGESLQGPASSWLAGRIARWVERLDDTSSASRLTVSKLFTLRAVYPTI